MLGAVGYSVKVVGNPIINSSYELQLSAWPNAQVSIDVLVDGARAGQIVSSTDANGAAKIGSYFDRIGNWVFNVSNRTTGDSYSSSPVNVTLTPYVNPTPVPVGVATPANNYTAVGQAGATPLFDFSNLTSQANSVLTNGINVAGYQVSPMMLGGVVGLGLLLAFKGSDSIRSRR